ncbi:MAG: DUF4468 domain-containing protein [Bacteroidota bacterium]
MKKTLLLLLTLPLFTAAQTFRPDKDIESAYTDQSAHSLDTVVNSNLTKKEIYSNALRYLTSTFKDSRSVIEMKDFELGEIAFKGNMSNDKNVFLYFKCRVYTKDSKFKIVLSSLEYDLPIEGMNLSKSQLRIAGKNYDPKENIIARKMAINLITDMSKRINQKSESEF